MDSEGEENFENLYEEGDSSRHDKLVDKLLRLNKTQQIKKPSRTEPALKVSEFDLVKSITGDKDTIEIDDLAETLKSRKNRIKIKDELNRVSKATRTLPKPLEKPQADRIKRGVAYERARLELDRFEAVVTSNRVANNLSFPLENDYKLEQQEAANFTNRWRVKSDFEQELEKIESSVETIHVETPEVNKFPLTMKEMMARRKEAAKLRAFQGYKEAKARRENKIKSKKYHRIKKKERIKQKLKEFEELQKTDPEEALKKLDEIEKARVEERFSLRHKSTGQWARSKQIRAKYDKNSRQVLAQQLSISKELTQKKKLPIKDSDDDEEEEIEMKKTLKIDESNPWIGGAKPENEVSNFLSDYRKFWIEKNKGLGDCEEKNPQETVELPENTQKLELKPKKVPKKRKVAATPAIKDVPTKQKKIFKKKLQKTLKPKGTTAWKVSVLDEKGNLVSIDEMFDKLDYKMEEKTARRVKQLKKQLSETKIKKKPVMKTKPKGYKVDLSLPRQKVRAIIDEELSETTHRTTISNAEESTNLKTLTNIILSNSGDKKSPENIDPNKYLQVKTTKLNTALPDILTAEDEEEDGDNNETQRDLISEAFEDDDIIHDFSKDKNAEINSDKPKDVDLNLPGWGTWGGTNIAVNCRKKRRFIVKAPRKIPRRDDNRGNLIINEKAQKKVKEHLVSELPFPFKSVKDFEASVRAPIGSSFVPEMAFKRLVRPAVTTKIGTIIEPMSKDILLNKKIEAF